MSMWQLDLYEFQRLVCYLPVYYAHTKGPMVGPRRGMPSSAIARTDVRQYASMCVRDRRLFDWK